LIDRNLHESTSKTVVLARHRQQHLAIYMLTIAAEKCKTPNKQADDARLPPRAKN